MSSTLAVSKPDSEMYLHVIYNPLVHSLAHDRLVYSYPRKNNSSSSSSSTVTSAPIVDAACSATKPNTGTDNAGPSKKTTQTHMSVTSELSSFLSRTAQWFQHIVRTSPFLVYFVLVLWFWPWLLFCYFITTYLRIEEMAEGMNKHNAPLSLARGHKVRKPPVMEIVDSCFIPDYPPLAAPSDRSIIMQNIFKKYGRHKMHNIRSGSVVYKTGKQLFRVIIEPFGRLLQDLPVGQDIAIISHDVLSFLPFTAMVRSFFIRII